MIISRTPFRIAFAGGGSDLPAFYERSPGAVVSMTIDKYMYVTVSRRVDSLLRVAYTRTELVGSVDELKHEIIREALRMTQVGSGVEITTIANVPAGTGLGSSSSLSVGVLNALYAFQGEAAVTSDRLGQDACALEMGILERPIGKQDQYAAAFGGLNYIRFEPDGSVIVAPIDCTEETRDLLSRRLVLFFTGLRGDNTALLRQQASETASRVDKFQKISDMAALAEDVRERLHRGDLDGFGELLDANWRLKRQLIGGISTPQIDTWYEAGLREGALGGKMLGAGGRGFLLFYCHESLQPALKARMGELGLEEFRIQLELEGSRIICRDT